MFTLKPKKSTFQWNKSHSNMLCGSNIMVKIVSKCHFLVSISKRFENFWVVITSKLLWTLQLPFVDICQANHWGQGPKFINGYKMWYLQAICFHQFLIVDLIPVDAYRVRRLQKPHRSHRSNSQVFQGLLKCN